MARERSPDYNGSSQERESEVIELRPYEEEGVRQALEHPGFCLFMEQRTGKTPTALKVVDERQPERLLIVCPNIAIPVWKAQIQEFKPSFGEVEIINFEATWSNRKRLRRWKPDFLLVDEAHRIKDRTSKQSRAVRYIANNPKCPVESRLALTGTPLEKGIWNAWAIYDFIDPTVFGEWKDFRDRYLIMHGFYKSKVKGTKNEDEFQTKLETRYYRVLLDQVSPHLVNHTIFKFPLAESKAAYDSMRDTFIVEIRPQFKRVKVGGKFVQRRVPIPAPRVITQIMKLHQITGGFIRDADGIDHHMGNEKLEVLGALLLRLRGPFVVFVRFIPELNRIARLCVTLNLSVTKISGKNPYEGGFATDVAIVQVQSGVAIDLARAKVALFYSMNHSFLDFEQARFRTREYGMTVAEYYYLVAEDTIDEDILESHWTKQSLSRLVLDRYRNHRRIKS